MSQDGKTDGENSNSNGLTDEDFMKTAKRECVKEPKSNQKQPEPHSAEYSKKQQEASSKKV